MNKQQNEEKNTPDVFKSLLEELNQAGYKLSGNIVVNIYRSGSQHVDRVENQYIGIRPTKVASKDKTTATAKPTAKSKAAAPKTAPKAIPTTTAKSATTTTTAKPTAPKAKPTAPKAKPTATTAKPTATTAKPTATTAKPTAKPKPTAPKAAPNPNRPTPPNPAAQLAPLPDDLRSQLRECLALLMQERIGSEPLLNRQSHWQAVYRILVDKGYCADSDFNGFDSFIRGVMPEQVNKPYTKGSVKMISQTPFVRPFGEWKFDPLIFKTRKPFERMVAVASRFLTLMDEHGLVKKRPNS